MKALILASQCSKSFGLTSELQRFIHRSSRDCDIYWARTYLFFLRARLQLYIINLLILSMQEYLRYSTYKYHILWFIECRIYYNFFLMKTLLLLLLVVFASYCLNYNQTLAIIEAKIAVITHCSTQQIQNWNCKICKDYPHLVNVTQIQNNATKISGFIGYDSIRHSVVVSWRGTTAATNWIQDLDFKLIDYTLDSRCSGCKVHQGFYNAYVSVSGKVKDKLAQLYKMQPTASLTITGHSLGGTLSLVTALFLMKQYPGKIQEMYLYGCPRVGNSNLAKFLHQNIPNIYRVIHNKDIVPHYPPHDLQYLHPPFEVLYDQQMANFKICNESGQDPQCSNQFAPNYSMNDHTLYWVKTDSSVC